MSCLTLARTIGTLCLVSMVTLSASSASLLQKGTSPKHVKVYKWMTDEGAKTVPATDTPLLASPPLSLSDRRLVRLCLARYGLWGVYYKQANTEETAERNAKSFLDRIPRAEIARRLVPIRKALYRGTRAYTSVSFVLADHGIDFEKNALRVVEAISLIETPTKLKTTGFNPNKGEDPIGMEGVAGAVGILYRKHHSAKVLRAYLRAPVDGHMGEDYCSVISTLFVTYPVDVLRVASTQEDLELLASAVYHGGGDWSKKTKYGEHGKVWRVIHKLERSPDPKLVRLTKRFRRVYRATVNSN